MQITGNIEKMRVELAEPVRYFLPVGDQELAMNELIGSTVSIHFDGLIHCIACGRKTSKSFNQGYCFPCMRSLARCDSCIVKPELCHFHEGTCREPEWGEQNCYQPHIVYLANSSGLKVGITRKSQVPTRWVDQGASQAIPMLEVPDRRAAGLIEVAFKSCVSDRTDWRRMLKGIPDPVDLPAERDSLFARCAGEIEKVESKLDLQKLIPVKNEALSIRYPVERYPEKVRSFNLDKSPDIKEILIGIKGQYLIFETGVINMRKYAGYQLAIEVL